MLALSVRIRSFPTLCRPDIEGARDPSRPERDLQGNQSDNRAQLSWVYRIDARLRAFVIFALVAAIALGITARDGVVGEGIDLMLAVYSGLFAVYVLFRFGYFADRVLVRLHGEDALSVEKMRSTQGGRRFVPTAPEKFIRGEEAQAELDGEDRVIGVEVNGDAVAFPMSAMALREVVNLDIGGERVAVSWWAVAYSARAFRRRTASDEVITLEPVPKTVFNSAVYDDETGDGKWVQFLGQAVAGERTGETLDQAPALATNWSAWSSAHPDTELLSKEGTPEWDIFESYYFNDRPGLHRQPAKDRRLGNKEMVFGVAVGHEAKAYPYRSLIQEPLIHDEIGREPLLVLLERVSATAAVFSRVVAGRVLSFEATSDNPRRPELTGAAPIIPDAEERDTGERDDAPKEPETEVVRYRTFDAGETQEAKDDEDDDGQEESAAPALQIEYEPLLLRDVQTGSVWRALTGRCIEGELEGERLRMLNGQTGFWFVWSRFYPHAELMPLPDEDEG